MAPIRRIMVICTGNICRSPMAAAILRDGLNRTGVSVAVESAGLTVVGGLEADPQAIKLMDERGLDIRSHAATQFTPWLGLDNDLILVMNTEQRHVLGETWSLLQGRVYRLGHWGNFDVVDPYQRSERVFRKALKSIDTGVSQWLEFLTA